MAALAAGACGGAGSAPPRSPQPARAVAAASAPGTFWEDTPVREVREPPLATTSLDPAKLVPPELAERFAALEPAVGSVARERGVAVVARGHERSVVERNGPFVVTLDVLFSIALRAVESAEAEVDEDAMAPAMADALARTDARLAAEEHAARSDTAEAYALARGVVRVGRKLLDPALDVGPAPDAVTRELAKIAAHAGPSASPLLGRVLDYGAFDTQAGLALADPRLPQFRAATWIARAPLALATAARVDHAATRTQTRAAMLLARDSNDAWKRLAELRGFEVGEADDPGPASVESAAHALGVDLRAEQTVENVVRVDQLARALLGAFPRPVEDTGDPRATFRLLAPSAPPDARALAEHATAGMLPSALAVATALGAPNARAELAAHASLHASALDAIATYLAEREPASPWTDSPTYRRRKLDVALAAFAQLRHADLPFARRAAREVLDEPEQAVGARGAVEPDPETIARLVSLVRQAQRGLAAHGGLRENGAAWVALDRAFLVLSDALHVAEEQARGPLPPPLARALATMPARIAALERRLGPLASPEIVVTAADLASGRLLEDATGDADEVWLAVDTGGEASLFVGVGVPFYERVATLRSTDASWQRELASNPPARPSF